MSLGLLALFVGACAGNPQSTDRSDGGLDVPPPRDVSTDTPLRDGMVNGDTPAPECGGEREPCCEDGRCEGILVCGGTGFCATCGRGGEPCCPGGGCNSGLECDGSVCRGCGGDGEPCCPGATPCAGGNTCVAGMCRACGVEPGTCMPGLLETEDCGMCGTRTRRCLETCEFAGWRACTGERACTPGATESTECGLCGTRERTCEASCDWGPFRECMGEGTCEPGTTVTGGCEGPCQARSCSAACMPEACNGTNPSCTPMPGPCSMMCPNGYHVARADCDTSCAAGCTAGSFVNRPTWCEPDQGTSFRACMICNGSVCSNPCGPGYYVSRIVQGNAADRNNCGLTDANMFICTKTTPSFNQCGTTCPPGYAPSGAPIRNTSTCLAARMEANSNIPNDYGRLLRCTGPGSP